MLERIILVEDIVRDAMSMLERQGYSTIKCRIHKTAFRGIARFSQSEFGGKYSFDIGERFIQSLRDRVKPVSSGYLMSNVLAVQRLNRVMEGDLDWLPSKPSLEYEDSCFNPVSVAYGEYLRNSGKTKCDIRSRMHVVARFLRHLDMSGIAKLSDITAPNIYESFEKASDKGGFHKCVSAFLRYAYRHGLIKHDFSVLVPSINRHIPVPTVYTPEEVEIIIAAAAQSKANGKRNKAIVLIASRLGLRSCDIANMRFENIHHDRETIELVQLKTKEPIRLPLLPEIREALDDYIENERPECDSDRIFLLNSLPHLGAIQPHTVYSIVSRIINTSGIDTNGRKRGAHALRSSLATALINEGYNHREVQEALGQKSPEAIQSYVKTEVEHLRDYALSVPKPNGLFAVQLGLEVTA
jgi:site-specific recombinase XerD